MHKQDTPLSISVILKLHMNIYFSGIGGVGIGPLAEIAYDAGHSVAGSDISNTLITAQLDQKGILVNIGQDGSFLAESHAKQPIDWLVYTSSLPANHPELLKARELGIKTGKRDEFLAEFIKEHSLKMIAIAGTHGKTNTTGMAVWAFKQLGIPVSYSVGTTISYGSSGHYSPASEYFIYECDEFDRNFLSFNPEYSLITSIDYDHPDTYPTEASYKQAFTQYIAQSSSTYLWQQDASYIELAADTTGVAVLDESATISVEKLKLAGEHTRRNATLVCKLLEDLSLCTQDEAIAILNKFPGTDRRFESILPGLYSDYGHHPKEIAATLQLAKEISDKVTLIYQPHQNVRQHEIKDTYTTDVFKDASQVYWLPTFLTRENPDQEVLTPQDLTYQLDKDRLTIADLNSDLEDIITTALKDGHLVLCMGAGTIDGWVRQYAASKP